MRGIYIDNVILIMYNYRLEIRIKLYGYLNDDEVPNRLLISLSNKRRKREVGYEWDNGYK